MDVPGDGTCRNWQRPACPGPVLIPTCPVLIPTRPVLAAPSRAGWQSWRSRPRVPRRGCGVRGRALTPSGISSTQLKTPGTSSTPCTRSQSTVSWHQLWPSLLGAAVAPVLGCLPARGLRGRLPMRCCLGVVPGTLSPQRAVSGSAAPAEPLRSRTDLSAFAPQPS